MHSLMSQIRSNRRRAAAVLLVAVVIPVLLGFAALTIDVGVIFNTRVDLQNAADAASLGATNMLSNDRSEEGVEKARAAALAIVQQHSTFGHNLAIDPADVTFGIVEYDEIANRFDFTPTEVFPDAVRVSMRSTEGSINGPVSLFFAAIFGKQKANVRASATAGLTGMRDIAVVIDLSGSMKHDSYLRFYDQTQINARDVWAALDGPEPSRPYVPGAEHETEYAGDTGPTIGVMSEWGNPIDPDTYDPLTDPGLWYIPSGAACTELAVQNSLIARGYNNTHRNALMNSTSAATWVNRTAVMIGVANWTPSSATDNTIGATELTWIPYPSYRKTWVWTDYINWAGEAASKLTTVHPQYRFQFGVKTYTDFLLDRVDNFSQTDLTHTPEEPMRSVKDGLQVMIDMTRSFDQVSLSVFGTTGHHEIDLTDDRQAVADRLYEMQPNHYDNSTNIGAGLQLAIDELLSPRAREEAQRVIVLMSDGAHTTGPDPVTVAQEAVEHGFRIYAISVGFIADRPLMQELAEMTGGQEFFAAGTPAEYTAELQEIFRIIGGLGNAQLIE